MQPIDGLLGSATPNRAWVNALVESSLAASAKQFEDAPPQPFTDRVVFDRAMTVIPGPIDDSVYVTRMLLRALFLTRRPVPRDIRSAIESLCLTALRLGDAVAARAGLGPYVRPGEPNGIRVPSRAELERLAAAVTWTQGEVSSLAPRARASAHLLAATSFGPLERTLGGWVITAPDLLLSALAEAIATLFVEATQIPDLARRYDDAIHSSIIDAVATLGFTSRDELVRGAGAFASNRFAAGSGTFVSVVQPHSHLRHVIDRSESAQPLAPIEGHLEDLDADPDDLLLVVAQPFADPYFDCPARSQGPWMLGMSAADLEVLADGAEGDDRVLARFARSANQVRSHLHVSRFSTLDEYSIYRDHEERHRFGQPADATALVIPPGMAMRMRLAWARGRGVEAAPWLNSGGTVEVTRRYRGDPVPIYLPPGHAPLIARVVMLNFPIWVSVETQAPDVVEVTRALDDGHGLVDALAYWLWQLEPHLRDRLRSLSGTSESISIVAELGDRGIPLLEPGQPALGLPVDVSVEGHTQIRLRFRGPLQVVADTNQGDRALATALVTGIGQLAGLDYDQASLIAAVDAVAPPGPKRMLVALDLGQNPEIAQRDAPRARPLALAEVEACRERLGIALVNRGWATGLIGDRDARAGLFRDAVTDVFADLRGEVKNLDASELLQALVWDVEATYQTSAIGRLQFATMSAAFGMAAEVTMNAARDLLGLDHPAVAVRFLIEYVAAQPSHGGHPVTAASLDRLIATGALLVEIGLTSDAMRFEVVEGDVEIRDGGRLTYASDLPSAMRTLGMDLGRHALARASDQFGDHWEEQAGRLDDAELPLAVIDPAYESEFGFTATDHARFLNAATLYADDLSPSVVFPQRETLVAAVGGRLGWPIGRVAWMLDALSLAPRETFESPPPGEVPADLYPWRFNRSLSYLRRPFVDVTRPTAGRSVLYGTRHLFRSTSYLFNLVASGRLRARTPAMRGLQGRLVAEASAGLVSEVAAQCQAYGMVVRTGVRKLGGQRIREGGRDLGDIDVLAVDAAKNRIWLLECKSLQVARTPWELHSEIRKLLELGGFIDRHARRVAWIAARADRVSDWLGVPDRTWEVRGALVTPLPLPSPLLRETRLPIIELKQLLEFITADQIDA